jgi:hypothetical protein
MFEDHSREASQGLSKSDLEIGGQVRASSTENWMFGLNEVEHDVAWLLVGYLIGFSL